MQASEIIDRTRRMVGDTNKAQIEDDDIINWINDAVEELNFKLQLNQVVATTDLIAGINKYSLPSDMYTIYSVKCNGVVLEPMNKESYTYIQDQTDNIPPGYYMYDDNIEVFPVPTAAKTKGLVVMYLEVPDRVNFQSDCPKISSEYHSRIVDYCTAQAFMLDGDRDSYTMFLNRYNNLTYYQTDLQDGSRYPIIKVTEPDAW
jgi:hypothetical protein